MCGIAGFSLNAGSKINARALAHALLTQIESRGRMSAGIAYPGVDGGVEVYKDAVAGSNLPLKTMPRNTKTAIMHTRYATKGSPSVNENNHPVWSPHGKIALVHNGVIWNDMSLRFGSLKEIDDLGLMPEVDTACIPALLEAKGVAGIRELAGDAAIAWLDVDDPHELHLARIESSPVAYTNLFDGSFVFASTPSHLRAALAALGIEHGEVFALSELDYYRLRGGVIWNYATTPQPQGYRTGLAASTRGATSGGHSTTTQTQTVRSGGSNYFGIGSTFGEKANEGGSLFSSKEADEDDVVIDTEKAMAMLDKAMKEQADGNGPGKELVAYQPDADEGEESWVGLPAFYTIDTDGNMETYDTLDELETKLLYLAGRDQDENTFGDGKVKWVNHFSDIGSFGFDGDSISSWLDESDELDAMNTDSALSYIKDGVSLLAAMVGR